MLIRATPRLCVAVLLLGSAPAFAQTGGDAGGRVIRSERIVHFFDFDERGSGNLEDLPKYWEPFRDSPFAHFATGGFDLNVGRSAPPSFHLSSSGRSVAYHYAGPETTVHTNSEYRIEGFIRADHLQFARAALSAHFLNADSRPIVGTMVRSRFIGGPDEPEGWTRVQLFLPAAPLEARTVGLIAWVLQEDQWSVSEPVPWHIPRTDVHGGAWFDDIAIHALPRVELSTNAPGNVLVGAGPWTLRVVLVDHEDTGLTGRLSILDATGDVVHTQEVPVVLEALGDPLVVPLDHLSPGLYRAELHVSAGTETVAFRKRTFARVAPWMHKPGTDGRPFGVIVDTRSRSKPTSELALLLKQGVRSAKLPVWSGLAEPDPTAAQRTARAAEIQELFKSGFALTGVFRESPSAIVRRGAPYPRPLMELLSGNPSVWEEQLAKVVAPNARTFRWWQIGADGADRLPTSDELSSAVPSLRAAMHRFIALPRLAATATMRKEPEAEKLPVEQLSLMLGKELEVSRFGETLARYRALGYDRITAYVAPLPIDPYRRLPRLADWAQRIVTARHAGADAVYVPQTWQTRETAHGWVSEPNENYLILRTIAEVLGSAVPADRLYVGPGVQCLVFDRGESATLVAWDPEAPPEGRDYPLQLGGARQQIDLWGTTSPLGRDEHDRRILHLSPLPVFIVGVERWLSELRNSFTIEPVHVESGRELVRHSIHLVNSRNTALSGRIQLKTPRSWKVTPANLRFNLMPHQAGQLRIEVHYPHNEPAGMQPILAQIKLLGDPYYLEVPLVVEIGLKGVEVWAIALIEKGALVLRHSVTNKTSETLHFRGSADVPGRARQYRPISNLTPGQTQTVEYRFARGVDLSGRRVHLGLREMNDGPRIHTLELRVP